MKRSKPLARTSSLKRAAAPLSRSKPLGRGNVRLKRSRREKAIMSASTRATALARNSGRCACGCGRRSVQVHHVFPRQRWPELTDSPLNVVGVAVRCHERHENAVERISLQGVLCALPLAWRDGPRSRYLERTYPAA